MVSPDQTCLERKHKRSVALKSDSNPNTEKVNTKSLKASKPSITSSIAPPPTKPRIGPEFQVLLLPEPASHVRTKKAKSKV